MRSQIHLNRKIESHITETKKKNRYREHLAQQTRLLIFSTNFLEKLSVLSDVDTVAEQLGMEARGGRRKSAKFFQH